MLNIPWIAEPRESRFMLFSVVGEPDVTPAMSVRRAIDCSLPKMFELAHVAK